MFDVIPAVVFPIGVQYVGSLDVTQTSPFEFIVTGYALAISGLKSTKRKPKTAICSVFFVPVVVRIILFLDCVNNKSDDNAGEQYAKH